jgi:hypothetical protein
MMLIAQGELGITPAVLVHLILTILSAVFLVRVLKTPRPAI